MQVVDVSLHLRLQLGLLLQVGHADSVLEPRVIDDLQRSGLGFAFEGQLDLVGSWDHERAARWIALVKSSGNLNRRILAEIPCEAVETGVGRKQV